MKDKNYTHPRASQQGHIKHIAMMAACCGLPLLLLVGFSVYGFTSQSLEFMILLICPIGMGAMMWMMMRSNRTASTETATTEASPTTDITKESTSNT